MSMQRGQRRAPRRARASANSRTVSVTVSYAEHRRTFTLSGRRPLRDGEYLISGVMGARRISAPRSEQRNVVRTIDFDVPRRTPEGRKIRRRDIERMIDDVPAGVGAMAPGNMMWHYARQIILSYPEYEKHLGIEWGDMTDESIEGASDDEESSSDESSSSEEEEKNLDLDGQKDVVKRIMRELNEVLGPGALLPGGAFGPPFDIGTDSQSIVLSGDQRITLEEDAARRRVRGIMQRMRADVRTGALGSVLFQQAVQRAGYGDWTELSKDTRVGILGYIEEKVDRDSLFWTRAGHHVGEGPQTVQEQIDEQMHDWEMDGFALQLYGPDFDEAADLLRAHMESRYKPPVEFDADDLADRLLAVEEVRVMVDEAVQHSLEDLEGRRPAAMGGLVAADARTIVDHLLDDGQFELDELDEWNGLSAVHRDRVRTSLRGRLEERLVPEPDSDEADDVYDLPGDDRVQHRLTGYYDGERQRGRPPALARRVYPEPDPEPAAEPVAGRTRSSLVPVAGQTRSRLADIVDAVVPSGPVPQRSGHSSSTAKRPMRGGGPGTSGYITIVVPGVELADIVKKNASSRWLLCI